MKIMLIGSNGQLGSDLVKALQASHDLVPLTHRDIEVTDYANVESALSRHRPRLVLNMAAFHKVDVCEEQIEPAFAVNAYGVRNLALACRSADAALLHMSTDYVFGGDTSRRTPYVETDTPAPINAYGISKLAGEYFVRYLLDRHFIVRVTGLYGVAGSSGKGGNFVELMLRLAHEGKLIRVVDDQRLTPTYTVDVARQVAALIETERYGLYHATSQGSCTWYEFAAEIFRQSGLSPDLSPAKTGEFGEKATRPAYSVLENKALQNIGLDRMRPWQAALAAYRGERQTPFHIEEHSTR
ncbi:MAG TPA: dTDP-4-dehydrorhamnose reductase [Anaerolineae bacterium]|nr:dTDP-4-dehydrorhamnose reductase [Anaerolineae bacterium]